MNFKRDPNRPTIDPRINPENLSIDVLRKAQDLAGRQKAAYWKQYPVPPRPVGRAPFEVLRQFAVFVVPAAIVALAYQALGLSLWIALAVAIAASLGVALHNNLVKAQAAAEVVARNLDQGRYEAVRYWTHVLNIEPEVFTLEVVDAMNTAYVVEHNRRLRAWFDANRHLLPEANGQAKVDSNTARHSANSARNGTLAATGVAAAVPFAAAAASETDWSHVNPASQEFDFGGINPATGLPLIDNTPIDVGGSVYGTDSHEVHYTPSQDFGVGFNDSFGSAFE